MKTIRLTTYWTPEEADCICEFLAELRGSILAEYGEEIVQMHKEIQLTQQEVKQAEKQPDWFDDEIPF